MKIIENPQDPDSVFIRVDSSDDLWYLKNIISDGDYVKATTYRRVEKKDDMSRQKETERIPVNVGIRVEKIEFQDFTDNLRMLGVVVNGPEDLLGKHQSMVFGIDDTFTLAKKKWSPEQRKMLKEAIETKFSETLYFLPIDDEGATLFLVRSYGMQNLGRVESHKQGKDFDSTNSDESFLKETAGMVNGVVPENSILIVLGPGFERVHFEKFFSTLNIKKIKIFNYASNRTDEGAVIEFLQSEISKSILKDIRLRKDVTLVNDFLKHLKTDGLATYGFSQVLNAIESGAVDTLLVSETKFRNIDSKDLIEIAEKYNSSIHIVSDSTEQGKILQSFGGYCAILRFSLSN